MKQLSSFLVFISFLVLGASQSQADVLIKLGLDLDNSTTKTTPGSSTKEDVLLTSLGLGYAMGSGVYLGAIYELQTDKTDTTETSLNQMGVSLGYVMGNGFVMFNYFAAATLKPLTTTEYTGTGMGVDLGYGFPIASSMKLGVQLNYRSLSYTKSTTAGVETDLDFVITNLSPSVFLSWKI